MSKRTKQHNLRNPNTCRVCLTNPVGKTRLAYGHTICQACARTNPETLPQNNADSNEEMPNEQ